MFKVRAFFMQQHCSTSYMRGLAFYSDLHNCIILAILFRPFGLLAPKVFLAFQYFDFEGT